ncbi:MAG: hypothetical protein MR522_06690 [Trueperella sp.]|uniref:hypothetical protein n=1 Tax=Trueperella sp. TaxID=2699835 RepID=UPI0025FEA871|nr:hypothetical protein [Trueperella sp.]MCI7305931.1 hypothetical protein [Trueperella sp.]
MTKRAAAIALVLTGCTWMLAGCSDVTKPASPTPTPSSSSPSAQPTPEARPAPLPEPVRNPYQGGAERAWSVELADRPSSVVYDRQSGTLVAALAAARGTQLHAFSVASSGRTLPTWTYEIPDGAELIAMDASSGSVFVSVGLGTEPSDLIVLSARSGAEELRWSRAHVLDTEVPRLVGAYDSGAGIARLGRDSVLAAVIDVGGDAVKDKRLFTADGEVTIGADIIDTGIPARSGTTFITFPQLSEVSGDECWSVTDGIVCVDAGQVVEYDERGNLRRATALSARSAGSLYHVQGMDPDVTAGELASALAETGEGDHATAVLAAGRWLTDIPAGAELLERGAPFALVGKGIVNLATGEALTDDGLAGEGRSADMFFEWDGSALHYLRPLG